MSWNFNVVPITTELNTRGLVPPTSVKITKTFFTDEGVELVTVDTDAIDAYENAEPGFIDEYVNTVKALYHAQIDILLNWDGTSRTPAPYSDGLVLGNAIKESIHALNTLVYGEQT